MIFAFSANAFAVESGTVTLTLDIAGQPLEIHTGLPVDAGDTVFDVGDSVLGLRDTWTTTPPEPQYSPLRDPNSPLYDPNSNAMILTGIDGNGSEMYVPNSAVEEYEDYEVGSDPVLDYYHYLYLAEYGGIAMWIGDGMAIMGDWMHMMYLAMTGRIQLTAKCPASL